MDHLPLLPASGWLGAFLIDQGQVALDQYIPWRENPPLLAGTLFLAALALLGLSLWLYQVCTRLDLRAICLARQSARQAADERAKNLLRAQVSVCQQQQLLTDGYLEVPSQLYPGRVYRIPAQPGRVAVYEAGRQIAQLCVVACDPVPHADLILAQKWLIEADEQAYLALANWIDTAARSPAVRGLTPPRLSV
jgi:hypothetical protein